MEREDLDTVTEVVNNSENNADNTEPKLLVLPWWLRIIIQDQQL